VLSSMEEKVEAKNRRSSCKGSKVQSIQGDHPQQSMLDGPTTFDQSHVSIFCLQLTTSTAELLLPVTHPVSPPVSMCCLLPPLCYHPLRLLFVLGRYWGLAGAALEGLSEEEELDLVVD